MIDKFVEPYDFLSNFYSTIVVFEGMAFRSSEAAFQAAKTDRKSRGPFRLATASESKKLGRQVALRSDWEEVKDEIMLTILRDKFSNPILRQALQNTADELLVEGNTWHDNYWGVCRCPKCRDKGENKLGKLLMQIREEYYND